MAATTPTDPRDAIPWHQLMKEHSPQMMPMPHTEVSWITPRAQLCPVCEGIGVFPPRSEKQTTCHGCDGKGWVTVR